MITPSSLVSIRKAAPAADCSAIVLAGGHGTRLGEADPTGSGEIIPKQYRSVDGGRCLLQRAVAWAAAVVGGERVWAVVAGNHERWWSAALAGLPPGHIIVQPQNKGTALGILLGLLTLERANAARTVLILPADHHVADEDVLLKALRRLTRWSQRDPQGIFLLGAQPEEPDPAFGYVLPWFDARDTPIGVYEFIERPQRIEAQKLINRGALWNTFIMAGSRQALLRAYHPRFGAQINTLRNTLAHLPEGAARRLEADYSVLAAADFSRDILEHRADEIKVLRLPHCGWTEAGRPRSGSVPKSLS